MKLQHGPRTVTSAAKKMSEEEYQQTFRVPVPGFKMLPLDDHAVLYLHVAAGEGRDGE